MSFGKRGAQPETRQPSAAVERMTRPLSDRIQEPVDEKMGWFPSDLGIRLGLKGYLALGMTGLLAFVVATQDHSPRPKIPPRPLTAKEIEYQCRNQEVAAYMMAQKIILQELKSPSTASFPWFSSISSRYNGDCRYQVLAYVDAQNSFGATLRNYFSVKFHLDPKSGTWDATSVNMN